MANTSAVIDVVVENKDISSILNSHSSQASLSLQNTSLIQSSSLGSLSTITDIENFSELNADESGDIVINVYNPSKIVHTLETYISYKVTSKIARLDFPKNEYTVQRRFNDFIWLRQKLLEHHAFCIIPALPEKHNLIGQLDRYSKEFVVSRMKNLNLFMSRIATHPILSKNEHFYKFLTAEGHEFIIHKKRRHSIPAKFKEPLVFTSLQTTTIDKNKTYLGTLVEKFNCLEKISNRIMKERNEYLNELNSFYPVFFTWSSVETELCPILKSIGDSFQTCASAQNVLVQSHHSVISNSIRDVLNYVEAVQEAIRRKDYLCKELDGKNTKNKAEKINSGSAMGSDKTTYQNQSDHSPNSLKSNKEHSNFEALCLLNDLEQWHLNKNKCVRNILLEFVTKQIEFEESRVNAWEQTVKKYASNPSLVKSKII